MRAMSDPAEMSGRELLEAALRGAAPAPPYVRLLRMRFIAVSDGSATFEMPATTELYNPNNVVHGGALASLADSAMGFAVFSTLLPGENLTTAELHLNSPDGVTAEYVLAHRDGAARAGQTKDSDLCRRYRVPPNRAGSATCAAARDSQFLVSLARCHRAAVRNLRGAGARPARLRRLGQADGCRSVDCGTSPIRGGLHGNDRRAPGGGGRP